MVCDDDLRSLQPGDTIRIISQEQAEAMGCFGDNIDGWVTPVMDRYCGSELTVYDVATSTTFARVYVEENHFWWRDSFIASIVREEYEPATDSELVELIVG